MFYAENGRITGRNPMWMQDKMTTPAHMSEWVGLYKNLGKTKAMISTPGFIWGQLYQYIYKQWVTGEGKKCW